MTAPVGFDDVKLRGDLPAEEPFLDPASILKGKSSPRGEVLFRGEELIVEVNADDEVKIRVSEPFPHDEFIYILSGNLLLTDTDGVERKYAAGDSLTVPKGFTGIWHQAKTFANSWSSSARPTTRPTRLNERVRTTRAGV